MAAIESLSSCGPQEKAQSPPPMAHAPKPMGERCRSELPSCFLFIPGLDAGVALKLRGSRQPLDEDLDQLVNGASIEVPEGGIFADFDESYARILKQYADQLFAFFETESFGVREIDGSQVASAEDVNVQVQQDCSGGWYRRED